MVEAFENTPGLINWSIEYCVLIDDCKKQFIFQKLYVAPTTLTSQAMA